MKTGIYLLNLPLPHKITLKMRCLQVLHCPDGYICLIINLKPLNLTQTFQMIETMHSIVCCVKLWDCLAFRRTPTTYYSNPLANTYHFAFQGAYFQFCLMPFSLYTASTVLIKVFTPIMEIPPLHTLTSGSQWHRATSSVPSIMSLFKMHSYNSGLVINYKNI